MNDAIEVVGLSLGVLIIFLGISSPVIIIAVVYYLKKRLEHKQIMAAIEKGTPLSELRPPKQAGPRSVRSISLGVAFVVFSLPFLYLFVEVLVRRGYAGEEYVVPFGIFFAIGSALLVRGFLVRRVYPHSDEQGTGRDRKRIATGSGPASGGS
jgi:hypothetical protein